MSQIPSISRHELLKRRRNLRRQRRLRILQLTWRALIVLSVASGVTWLITRPDWMLRDASQVIIEGNKSVPTETIRSLLPLKYPQFLLTLQPKEIAHRLESQAAIDGVSVSRSLFPPSLTIKIQERYPVATVYAADAARSPDASPIALLDERGNIMDYQNYLALNQSQALPNLKVIALREAERAKWTQIYQQVSRSPVKIFSLDWTNPSNLMLQTELGIVRVGGYNAQTLTEQLRVLDRMRQLPQHFALETVEYIDLKNPKKPLLKLAGYSQPNPIQTNPDDPNATPAEPTDAAVEEPTGEPVTP